MGKYKEDMMLLQTEDYSLEMNELTEKYQNNQQSPEFIKELLALRIKHAPNLANMDQEMHEANKKLGLPEGF
jgi:6-phosphogluconate dehydrogenase (decarboxylating)